MRGTETKICNSYSFDSKPWAKFFNTSNFRAPSQFLKARFFRKII